MVFLNVRVIFGLAAQFAAVFVRIISLFWCQFMDRCPRMFRTQKKHKVPAFFNVFTSDGDQDDMELCAVFTIEAAIVLGIVFMSVALLIRYAYTEHDKVTGTSILQEMLIHVRQNYENEDAEAYFEDAGKQLGNPRLWLGEYEIEISSERSKVSGKASAGEWRKEIEMELFRPGMYIRQRDYLTELLKDGEEKDEGEHRVQTGNESELYGDPFGNEME